MRCLQAARRFGDWFARASWTLRIGFLLMLALVGKGFHELSEAGVLWYWLAVVIAASVLADGKSRREPGGTRSDSRSQGDCA